jgi:hypothetical protein
MAQTNTSTSIVSLASLISALDDLEMIHNEVSDENRLEPKLFNTEFATTSDYAKQHVNKLLWEANQYNKILKRVKKRFDQFVNPQVRISLRTLQRQEGLINALVSQLNLKKLEQIKNLNREILVLYEHNKALLDMPEERFASAEYRQLVKDTVNEYDRVTVNMNGIVKQVELILNELPKVIEKRIANTNRALQASANSLAVQQPREYKRILKRNQPNSEGNTGMLNVRPAQRTKVQSEKPMQTGGKKRSTKAPAQKQQKQQKPKSRPVSSKKK